MLRRIEPMKFSRQLAPPSAIGAEPSLRWVDPTSLLVDETYQREITDDSKRLIRRIAECFTWARMKPPIVTEVRAGLHIIDGQHTAIAAATIGLKKLPVFVVSAEADADRARAFVGHNTDRIHVSRFGVHKALLAAGDPDAVDIANVCHRAGVRIRTALNHETVAAEGDTIAIGSIARLIRKRGVQKARRALEVLVKGQRAPISAQEISAVDLVMFELQPGCDLERLAAAIRDAGDRGIIKARSAAALEKRMLREVIAEMWIKRMMRAT